MRLVTQTTKRSRVSNSWHVSAMFASGAGMFVARMLSFEGTSFEVVNCPLDSQLNEVNRARPKTLAVSCVMVLMSDTVQCYERSSAFWIKLRRTFISALKTAAVFDGKDFAEVGGSVKCLVSFCQLFSRARLLNCSWRCI